MCVLNVTYVSTYGNTCVQHHTTPLSWTVPKQVIRMHQSFNYGIPFAPRTLAAREVVALEVIGTV